MHTGRCDYAAEILNIDDLFRKVLNEVEAMGEMARTIVCMSSDHGELLGE
jgi:membrane-anchored protein YejM (alkaline phosphatase superfamily)